MSSELDGTYVYVYRAVLERELPLLAICQAIWSECQRKKEKWGKSEKKTWRGRKKRKKVGGIIIV